MNSADCIVSIELAAAARNTLCISGPPGIGKTSITQQFAERQGEGYFYGVFNGATANLADTIGFLLPHDVEYTTLDGNKVSVPHGRYTYPHYFMDRSTRAPAFMFQKGMIVVEEYGQASPDVKRALATLLHEKRVGDHELPAGFQIVVLTNRASDRSGVGKDFDFVINRRVDIEFEPEYSAWVDWAAAHDVEPLVMAFANRQPEIVFAGKVPEKQGPWCTPRSLVAAGETLRAGEKLGMDLDSPILISNLQGSIGNTAIQLMAFAKLRHSLPRLSDIMADPLTAMVPDAPDGLMVISFELAHRATRDNVEKIVTYMKRTSVPYAVTFVKTLLKKTPALVATKAIGDWSRENHQLLAAISR